MANDLGIKKCWFHKHHYDVPKRRIEEIKYKCALVSSKRIVEIIKNEFLDKNYKTEYPIGIYSLDFAWVDLKKAIEIDGDQHKRFYEYKERDNKKDALCIKHVWKILRIRWRDLYNNTKEKINEAKKFIDH